jgi:putative oxidoreductase
VTNDLLKETHVSALALHSFIARYFGALAQLVRARTASSGHVVESLRARMDALDAAIHRWLVAYSITVLRVSLGAVFFSFGLLKYFPGVSPAQDLAERTTQILTVGLIPDAVAMLLIATLECVIGLCLITGRGVRSAVYLLTIELVGILSPVVLLTGRLFSGPHGAPTLEGQYVLKDVILVGAALVLAATLRGGRLTSPSHEEGAREP